MNDKYYFNPQICAPVLDYTIALNTAYKAEFSNKPQRQEGVSALQLWQQHLHNTRSAQQRH